MSQRQRQLRTIAAQPQASSAWPLRRGVLAVLLLAALGTGTGVYLSSRGAGLEPLPLPGLDSLPPSGKTAIEIASDKVRSHARSAQAWGDLGAVLRAYDQGEEAEACFRNAEALDNADYRWPYLLGVSVAPRDAEQALECFRRASRRCGDKPHVLLRLAEMLIDRRLHGEAAVLVSRSLAIEPDDPRAQLAQARLLLAQEKLMEAKEWAEKSAAAAPNRRAPHLLAAQLCRRTGDAAGVVRELTALESIPDGITPWDDSDVAAVLELRPASPSASLVFEQARALIQSRDYASAAAVLQRGLRDRPDDERLQFQLGVVCFQQGAYQDATEAFGRAINLKPDYVDAQYNLGHALLKTGEKAAAQAAFAAAVRLRPSHAAARINLADLLLQEHQIAAARRHLEVAVELAPQEQRAHELLAKARQSDR